MRKNFTKALAIRTLGYLWGFLVTCGLLYLTGGGDVEWSWVVAFAALSVGMVVGMIEIPRRLASMNQYPEDS